MTRRTSDGRSENERGEGGRNEGRREVGGRNEGRPPENHFDFEEALAETQNLEKTQRGLQSIERIAEAFAASNAAYDESASPRGGEPVAAAATTDDRTVAFRWGPLEILHKLGEGSYGEVYRAHDPKLARDVALKLLVPRGGRGRDLAADTERFLEEGRRLARVNHPHVLTVHGADEHDGRVGLWAELLSGETLEERLQAGGRLSAREATGVGLALCRALAAIHGAGLVHGDVKASNVMREEDGNLVLLDFGSGREIPVDESGSLRDVPTGTPLSLAPEVLGGSPATPSADLYALGVLLYRLVAGEFPLRAKTYAELVAKHGRGESTPLRDLRPDLPGEFVRVVERALAGRPDERFASAGAMEQALEASERSERPTEAARPAGNVSPTVATGQPAPAPSGGDHANAPSFPWTRWAIAAAIPLLVFFGWNALRGPGLGAHQASATLFAARLDGSHTLQTGDSVQLGDRLYLEIQSDEPMHVYVLDEDEAGELYVLFPVDGLDQANPLPPGKHRLPGTLDGVDQDWEVTSVGGRETILIVSSREPLPPIERELALLPAAQPGTMLAYAELDPAALERLRGIGGMKPSLSTDVPPTGRLAELADDFRSAARAQDLWLQEVRLTNPR